MTFLNIQKCRQTVLPLLISGLIISCSPLNPLGLASQEYTVIAELNKVANRSLIQVQGIVVNVAPFLDGGAYQLQDATGSVWVKTDKPLPKKGVSLSVKGEIQYEGISVGQQQLSESYILEVSQEPQPSAITQTSLSVPASPAPSPIPAASPIPSPSVTSEVSLPETSPTPVPSPSPSVTPTASPAVSAQPLTVTPSEPTQIAVPVGSPTTQPTTNQPKVQPPAKLNLDDRFLPHKSLPK